MFIKGKKIISSQVFTKSSYYLGKVIDFKVNTENQSIIEYYVSKGFFNLKRPLIIRSSQVIEIRKRKIIVEDATISEKITKKKTTPGIEYAR